MTTISWKYICRCINLALSGEGISFRKRFTHLQGLAARLRPARSTRHFIAGTLASLIDAVRAAPASPAGTASCGPTSFLVQSGETPSSSARPS
jgi:hypothetical protein